MKWKVKLNPTLAPVPDDFKYVIYLKDCFLNKYKAHKCTGSIEAAVTYIRMYCAEYNSNMKVKIEF